jgi:hypothetical protein
MIFMRKMSHLNTYHATINELLIGYYLSNEVFDKYTEPEKVKERLKLYRTFVSDENYSQIDSFSRAMAKDCFKWFVKNKSMKSIEYIEWSATGNHNDPSDLKITFKTFDDIIITYGISIKCSIRNATQLGFKNYSYKTVFESHFQDKEIIPSFKEKEKLLLEQYGIFNLTQKKRKELIRVDEKLFKNLYPHSVERLSNVRDIFYNKLETIQGQALNEYIFSKWFNKTIASPYIKLTGNSKTTIIEDFSNISPIEHSIEFHKTGNNNIRFMMNSKPLCDIHSKNNSEMFCSPIQLRAVSV